MPGITVPQRRRIAEDDDDDDLLDPESPDSQSSKRQRLTPVEGSDDSDNEVLPNSYRSAPRARARQSGPSNGIMEERHQPGAIVRIKVKNFVTYTAAEFRCGPSLNMIIGPNGTGKSTLVCAICLGLGWKSSVLGRAKEIGEYVKTGTREAEIEIELAAGPKQKGKNPVIRHVIKREGNKSTWYLNGSSTTLKEVLALARSFHIQIDNLCQFLPQDRVAEFANMTPVQLLESTQKAAAEEQMTIWHTELKRLGADRKKMLAEKDISKTQLEQLHVKQKALKADVDKMKERELLLKEIALLEKCEPAVAYRVEKGNFDERKALTIVATKELEEKRLEVEPALAEVTSKTAYKEKLENLVHSRKNLQTKSEAQAQKLAGDLEALKKRMEGCDVEVEIETEGAKKNKADFTKYMQQLTQLKNKYASTPPEFDFRAHNAKIQASKDEARGLQIQKNESKDAEEELRREKGQKEVQLEDVNRRMKDLSSQSGQQFNKLQNESRDTAKAWNWVRKNQGLFKERIYGPAIVECSVKDLRYANAVEAMLGRGEFLAFTTTNSDDWRLLQDKLHGEFHLKDITIRVAGSDMSQWQPPLSRDELSQCGLDGYTIDYIEGPAPVLSMFCDNRNLHRSAVSLRDGTEQQYTRLENSPINQWVTGQMSYRISRRAEYGPKATSTSSHAIRNARYWTGQAIDRDAQQQLQGELRELQTSLGAIDESLEELRTGRQEFDSKLHGLVVELKQMEKEKADLQKTLSEFSGLPTKISNLEAKLDDLRASNRQVNERKRKILERKDTISLERGQAAINFSIAVNMVRKMHQDLFEAELWLIEADSELHILTEKSSDVRRGLEDKENEMKRLKEEQKVQKEKCIRLYKKTTDIQAELQPDEVDPFQEIVDNLENTIETIDGDIKAKHTRLALLHDNNPQAIVQYEARQRKIDELTAKVDNFEGDLAKLNDEIQETREQWEPKLDELVSEISDAFAHNFARIGCAGEVGVHKDDEDFTAWAIKIQVRFRENEQMSILDSHRQSGGERAVSTIFYLMGLQSLARSPFRVVDEINQGMDPRNERLVHERMVDIACSENTSQYFLITPKLLNGLKYHPRMMVHVIYSGHEMPEDNSNLNFQHLANLALRRAEKAN